MAVVLAALVRNGAPSGFVQTQLAAIAQLQRQIDMADASTLAAMPAAVASMVAEVLATAQQGSAAASGAEAAEGADIASLATTSRDAVNCTMQGMKDFDLTFASAEDEAAYRRREAERLALIEAEQKKGTPEGDLNAAGAAVGQMADAAAHGAATDPRFQQRWEALVDSTEKLRAQIIREGGNVSKFDTRLRDDLRQIMKSKGKTDAEIDTLLAAHPDNPMDAMSAFVAEQKGALTERDLETVRSRVEANVDSVSPIAADAVQEHSVLPPSPDTVNSFDAALADFAPAKLAVANHDPADAPAHGVSANAITPNVRGPVL